MKPRNKAPEKTVVIQCMSWLRLHGFSCDIVESKAVFSQKIGRYVRGNLPPGFTDIVGCDGEGWGVFVETKAPGKRSTLKTHQAEFLCRKIHRGAFAACVDSVESLSAIYRAWKAFKVLHDEEQAIKVLLDHLPKNLPTSLLHQSLA